MPEGRIPPQNIEAELSVLGAMMLKPSAATQALELLRAEDFYRQAHRAAFDAMDGRTRRYRYGNRGSEEIRSPRTGRRNFLPCEPHERRAKHGESRTLCEDRQGKSDPPQSYRCEYGDCGRGL